MIASLRDMASPAGVQRSAVGPRQCIPALERAGPEGDPALRFDGVVRRYGTHIALDHLNLQVAQGETVALLGPNGAGKSTTISLLLGLLRPHAGFVQVLGTSARQAVADGRVGAMLQTGSGSGLPPGVRVSSALQLVRRLYRHPAPFDLTVERAGIGDLLGRSTHRLSGGQAQRVRFAVAIAGDPELVFLDEPTAAMDVDSRRSFWRMMRQFGEEGRTIVFATHHLQEADVIADRVVVINRGRVVANGPGATLKAAVATRQVRFVTDDPDEVLLDQLDRCDRCCGSRHRRHSQLTRRRRHRQSPGAPWCRIQRPRSDRGRSRRGLCGAHGV